MNKKKKKPKNFSTNYVKFATFDSKLSRLSHPFINIRRFRNLPIKSIRYISRLNLLDVQWIAVFAVICKVKVRRTTHIVFHALTTDFVVLKVQLFSGPKLSSLLTFGPPRANSLKHEYGELACAIELVSDLDSAVNHIHTYGSGHTEVIVTENSRFSHPYGRYEYRSSNLMCLVFFFPKIRRRSFKIPKRRR